MKQPKPIQHRIKNNWFGEDILNNLTNTASDLQPLATTMSDALRSVGITPPSELANLAQSFHDNIVVPANGTMSGNIGDNILSFVSQNMTALANGLGLSKTNKIVANGGNNAVSSLQLSGKISDMFSNPLTWIFIAVVIGGIIYFFRR